MNAQVQTAKNTTTTDFKTKLLSTAPIFIGGFLGLGAVAITAQSFGLMTALGVSLPLAGLIAAASFWPKPVDQERTRARLDMQAKLRAIDKVQAIIEFDLDGKILDANQNFCDTVGYRHLDIVGKHHSMFVDPKYAASPEYEAFWQQLRRGEFITGEFQRYGRDKRDVWIMASYNPVFDENGKPFKVVKFATDITEDKVRTADMNAQIDAISASQAVIEFDLKGNILRANENFCSAMGYPEADIIGKHHSMFVLPEYASTPEYRGFWDKLARGDFDTGEYERVAADGRRVILQASYNPIFDLNGRPFKVVKYATDLSSSKRMIENARIRSALDAASTCVMVADAEFNITYMNEAQREMMIAAEKDLQAELSNFDATNLLGKSMDVFHKNPAHQRGLLNKITRTYKADIRVGPRHFNLIATPVFDNLGERQGTVVEWRDETAEKAIEGEVQTVVEAVSRGDFSKSIVEHGKQGFMLNLAKNVNVLSSRVSVVVDALGAMLQSLSSGDLTERIEEDFDGVYGRLKDDANTTAAKLLETVQSISHASQEVAAGSQEISAGAEDLSQRTEQQAASLEETASSMQQMTVTIKQNADNSHHASQLAVAARDSAVEGGQVVDSAVESMSRIEDSSRRISDIIGVIDEIAFQTNLLALNAAVEAARAGDAGRGFAVVASEVRSLAQRSAQAAKDIKDLIIDSSGQVEEGVSLVNRTGEALSGIVDSVKKVADIVAEISAASEEQATGAEEINRAVMQMDEMTQQNSALVEENAAAAKTMRDQAGSMRASVGFFNVGDGDQTGQAIPSQRPVRAVAGGGARRLQSALAERMNEDDDWSEF